MAARNRDAAAKRLPGYRSGHPPVVGPRQPVGPVVRGEIAQEIERGRGGIGVTRESPGNGEERRPALHQLAIADQRAGTQVRCVGGEGAWRPDQVVLVRRVAVPAESAERVGVGISLGTGAESRREGRREPVGRALRQSGFLGRQPHAQLLRRRERREEAVQQADRVPDRGRRALRPRAPRADRAAPPRAARCRRWRGSGAAAR